MVDITFSDILFIIQNLSNPVVFFPVMIFLTGYLAVKLGFGSVRNWRGLDQYLSALGVGFGMQSVSLLLSIIIAGLSILQGYNFNSVFAFVLFLSTIITLLVLLSARMEAGVPLIESYRRLVSSFWLTGLVSLATVPGIVLIISQFYPAYLSELILPAWTGVAGLIFVMTVPLVGVLYYLNRWFLLPPTREIPLTPMGRPKKKSDIPLSLALQSIRSRQRQLVIPILLIVLILGSAALDASYAIFTPKMHFGDVNEDRYFYHYPYSYPYDYYMTLTPDNNGRLVGTTYALYNVTYSMGSAMVLMEPCVRYPNPAGLNYLLSAPGYYVSSGYSSGYVIQPSYFGMNKLGADSTSLVSIGNQTNTGEIQQCTAATVHFSYWKKISLTSITVVDSCIVQRNSQVRMDNISIVNHNGFRVFLGAMTLIYSYVGKPDQPVKVAVAMNGHNLTGAVNVAGPFVGPVVVVEPFPTIFNPFNSTLSIDLSYNSTFVPACPEG